MSVDVESQLAALGTHWRETVRSVDVAEVVGERPSARELRPDGPSPQRPRWLLAACAALLLLAIVGITVLALSDDDSTPTTVVPTSLEPDPSTTVTDSGSGAGSWTPVGMLDVACVSCGGVLLTDGRVLVTGAYEEGEAVLQAYDPTTARFTVLARLPGPSVVGTLVLPDDRVLLSRESGELMMFDPVAGEQTPLADRLPERGIPVLTAEGEVLLFGPSGVHTLDVGTGELAAAGMMAAQRNDGLSMVAVPLLDGTVLVAGGTNDATPAAERYDPATDTFAPIESSYAPADASTATPLLDGRVLFVGGASEGGGPASNAVIFDPETNTFSPTGAMRAPRWLHAAVRLTDGRVLVVGGSSAGDELAGTELWDPSTGEFAEVADTNGRRIWATAVALENDLALVFGNYPGNAFPMYATDGTTAEVFSFADFVAPPGCCDAGLHDKTFSLHVAGTAADALVQRPLQVRVTVPAGGFSGAVKATVYVQQQSGSGGGDVVEVPSSCEVGCEFVIPVNVVMTDGSAVAVTVLITFEGTVPVTADDIAISLEPRP